MTGSSENPIVLTGQDLWSVQFTERCLNYKEGENSNTLDTIYTLC